VDPRASAGPGQAAALDGLAVRAGAAVAVGERAALASRSTVLECRGDAGAAIEAKDARAADDFAASSNVVGPEAPRVPGDAAVVAR
jgi:hypothetical protein